MDLTFTCMDVEQNPLVSQFDERRDLCHSWLMANTENLTLFLKAIKTVAKENEHPIPPHLAALTEGGALTETDDLNAALLQAGESFDDAQCGCLFANLSNLNIKDGRLQNRDLKRESVKALRIDVRDANDVVEAVKTLIQTPEYFQRPEDWDLFCAGLLAMAHADQEFTSEEKAYLQRYVPNLKHIEAGAKIVKEKTPSELGETLAELSSRQRRCLAAHSIGIMFIDGSWKGSEQEFLDLAMERMRIVQFDSDRLLKGLHTLFNVNVFG
jgi:hypothetical protein